MRRLYGAASRLKRLLGVMATWHELFDGSDADLLETDMEHGRLIEMGQLETIDQDDTRTKYKFALVIEFASAAEIRQAINDGKCTFGWGEDQTPNP